MFLSLSAKAGSASALNNTRALKDDSQLGVLSCTLARLLLLAVELTANLQPVAFKPGAVTSNVPSTSSRTSVQAATAFD